MPKILTLDLGTTYFKACLFDGQGTLLHVQRLAPPIERPQPNWWEVPVAGFRRTVTEAITALGRSAGGLQDVAAVCFATQTNSFCLLDGADQPLTPLILWPDQRAMADTEQVQALSRVDGFRAATGLCEIRGMFMAAKLRWLARERPEVFAQARRLCLISDYLTLWFSGRHLTEAGAVGLSGLVDIHQLQWMPPMLQRFGLRAEMLASIVRAGADAGTLLPAVAGELGLPPTCRMIVGCLDQYAGAIGAGNVVPDAAANVSETTGTVLAAVRCTSRINADAPLSEYQGPAYAAGIYYRMAFGSTSANLLEWYRNLLPDRPPFEALGEAAAAVSPGCDGLRVKPRADLEPSLEAGFVGLGPQHGRGHCTRAIMEKVAFALREHVLLLCDGRPPGEVHSSGGGSRSDLWLQIKADVLGCPFVATICPEPTSLGAAMLAGQALGWGSLVDLAQRWIKTRPPLRPRATVQAAYQALVPAMATSAS